MSGSVMNFLISSRVDQALLWADQRQNEVRPWRFYGNSGITIKY